MSASNSRRRTELVGLRLLPTELQALREAAAERGSSVSELLLEGVQPIIAKAG